MITHAIFVLAVVLSLHVSSATTLDFPTETLLQTLSAASRYTCDSPPAGPPTEEFCVAPPTVPVRLYQYQGTWFQIYSSGSARRFGDGPCVTANYYLRRNGTVAVLNCDTPPGELPLCIEGTAAPRTEDTGDGKLAVSFPVTGGDPGRYNVAALLGNAYFGYFAAAVYSCELTPGGPDPGFFILARSTEHPEVTLELLKNQLACNGYNTKDVDFVPTKSEDCTYFYDGDYDIRTGFNIGGPTDGVSGGPPGGPPM